MRRLAQISLLAAALVATASAAAPANGAPNVAITYDGQQLQFAFPSSGVSLIGLHYSINKLVIGVEVGEVNVDLRDAVNNQFVYQQRVALKEGDFVSYWYVAIVGGEGYQRIEQRWDYRIAPPPTSTLRPAPTSTMRPKSTTTARPAPTTSNGPPPTQGPPATEGPPATQGPPATSAPPTEECTSYPCLVFEDNFDYLDLDKWEHEMTAGGGGNWEFQYYHNNRRNSFTRDGKLFIKPTLTAEDRGEDFVRNGHLELWGSSPANLCTGNQWWGCSRSAGGGNIVNPIQSARLRSVNSFAFRYGRIEVEAKMPTGDWIWPAIWMLPRHNEYGEWPSSGEIDLVESRGNRNLRSPDGKSAGVDQMGMTLHWGPKWPFNGYPKTHATRNLSGGKTFGTDFHKYQLEWSPEIGLVFSLDGEHVMTVNPPEGFWEYGKEIWVDEKTQKPLDKEAWNPWKPSGGATRLAPFDRPFYIIMNVAVGGVNYFGDELTNAPYPKPWRNTDGNAAGNFYNAKHLWLPTWQDDNDQTAMQVNHVRVWKLQP